eukprot:gene22576-biopygen14787
MGVNPVPDHKTGRNDSGRFPHASRTTGMDETDASRTCSLSFLPPAAGACNTSLPYLSCRVATRRVPFILSRLKHVSDCKT